MAMTYEDQVAIGGNLNDAIQRTLKEYVVGADHDGEVDVTELTGALARAILVQLDQAGYKIIRK